MTKGFFSIIQYCPDLDRAEGANLGVVLCVPEFAYCDVLLCEHNEHVKKLFGAPSYDDQRLNVAKKGFAHHLKAEVTPSPTLDALLSFSRKSGNHLLLTPPRTVVVRERPESLLRQLFGRLASAKPPRRRERTPAPSLEQTLIPRLMTMRVPFERNVAVHIPNFDPLNFPLAYRNGVQNLVTAEGFPASPEAAQDKAYQMAVRGQVIHNNPAPDGTERRMIVVARFKSDSSPEIRDRVVYLLHQCHARLIEAERIEDFAEEIQREAH